MAQPAPSTADSLPQRDVYTVSRLNREARAVLEMGLPLLWVEGELSNLARPASGHLYFSLKDSAAQVRCAMFRTRNVHLGFTPENGAQVVVRGRVSLYEPRGDYQLIVEHMEEAGAGALRRAFEELKQRLAAEGLFEKARKRPLPRLPQRIGVITSPSGAAVRDILHVLRRRFPGIEVMIYPVPVQGEGAAREIAETLRLASHRAECDVIVLARGGGSLEDLQAFNEEVVARAICECTVPVVTGVGHEIDFTIADFVSDQRAPTPSAAAELVSPDGAEWRQRLQKLETRLTAEFRQGLARHRDGLRWLEKRLGQQHPGQRLRQHAQRLDELSVRAARAQDSLLRHRRIALAELAARLHQHVPVHRVQACEARRTHLTQRLTSALNLAVERHHRRLEAVARALHTVSPLATLSRGYAIVRRLPDRTVVRAAHEVEAGDAIEALLGQGTLICRVEKRREN